MLEEENAKEHLKYFFACKTSENLARKAKPVKNYLLRYQQLRWDTILPGTACRRKQRRP